MNKLIGPLITCFLPSAGDSLSASYWQMFSFLTDLGPVYAIRLLESHRIHSWAVVILPGVWVARPLYFVIEHLRNLVAKLLHGRHEIKPNAPGSFLPALIAGYYGPHFGNFFPKIVAMRQCFHAIWQLFPITVQAPFRLLEKCAYPPVRPRPQQREEAKQHSTKNLRYIRSMYPALALVFGLTFIHTLLSLPEGSSTASLVLPGL
ncbi:hypothetical protein BDV30DRAFT_240451 [Aspergillus minisclerotigenes]|uniref:Uncharacterized protein n=1 Tax=Aspergillus minisclerotigenes TaxID=656917 RepID=A0A5N6IZD6_9EURO|nr:hypothetical protein BDV30DRAFT_240451 [Aspergillus minisclerotigenes]